MGMNRYRERAQLEKGTSLRQDSEVNLTFGDTIRVKAAQGRGAASP